VKYRIERISNGWLLYITNNEKNEGRYAFPTKAELLSALNTMMEA
jgi:hypothetical protein